MSAFRFAPSPNGELHLGHAYSALLNADLAEQMDGRLLLRIEDIDTTRCTPEFEAGIYRELAWLGIEWEQPVRRQSEHFADYAAALDRLKAMGLVYPAFMSRGEVRAWIAEYGKDWPRDPDGAPHYPPVDKLLSETERQARMASGQPFAWRLDVEKAVAAAGATSPTPSRAQALATPPPLREVGERGQAGRRSPTPEPGGGVLSAAKRGGGHERELLTIHESSWREFNPADRSILTIEADPQQWGDVILARSDTPTSYHLSVVVDDALQGITHVVRGKDLYEATGVHRLLQNLLDLPEPLYHHHRLIPDADGRKLSKSEHSTGLRTLREAGVTPAAIRGMVGL